MSDYAMEDMYHNPKDPFDGYVLVFIFEMPSYTICSRVIEFLRNFEFRNWHAMRGGLMLPDSIFEEKLEID